MPKGITASNSTTKFPEHGWGEVRGFHGQLCIAGPDRPGFDVTQLVNVVEFPGPSGSANLEDSATAATGEEVREFLAKYRSRAGDVPQWFDTIVAKAGRATWRASRHDRARDALAWAMRDTRAGLIPAADAVEALRSQFLAAVAGDVERHGMYPDPVKEIDVLVAWGRLGSPTR